jgi:amino acid transporter
LSWLARVSALALICNVLVDYLSFFWKPVGSGVWRVVVITSLVVVLAIINIIGVSRAAMASDIFAIGKLIPLVLFVVVGSFFIGPQHYSFATPVKIGSFSFAVSLLFVSFTGFEQALIAAGEVRDPQRNLPFGLLVALSVVTLLYVSIQLVCIGTLPQLSTSEKPLADAGSIFLGPTGAVIITGGVLISGAGTISGILLSGPRLLFAMAEFNQLPQTLSATHQRFHTPHIAILLTALFGLALALSGTYIYTLTLAALSKLITFATICGALPVLRRRGGEKAFVFRLPFGYPISILALSLCLWLLFNSGWRELRDVGIAAVVGLLFHVVYRLRRGPAISPKLRAV